MVNEDLPVGRSVGLPSSYFLTKNRWLLWWCTAFSSLIACPGSGRWGLSFIVCRKCSLEESLIELLFVTVNAGIINDGPVLYYSDSSLFFLDPCQSRMSADIQCEFMHILQPGTGRQERVVAMFFHQSFLLGPGKSSKVCPWACNLFGWFGRKHIWGGKNRQVIGRHDTHSKRANVKFAGFHLCRIFVYCCCWCSWLRGGDTYAYTQEAAGCHSLNARCTRELSRGKVRWQAKQVRVSGVDSVWEGEGWKI